ncbi:hypothetical protein GSY71_13385 [Pusillimonas sp. TS35]|uniref:I78 family peptidase inhibitor n=1 Tax=Paracandidimonas lactea TaxID=2895524 RepID=UPI00136FB1B8|nr:I78 family peptidase inhibitor [Paracandidimonas lactea]MYN14133.1 hypothetical protein [Pusillimonas sp. TS35]
MTWKLITSALAALALLAGCASTSSSTGAAANNTPAATETSREVCNADLAQAAVGKKADGNLVEQFRKAANAKKARMLRPRDVMTLEYDPQRLNLRVDDQDIVISVNCS